MADRALTPSTTSSVLHSAAWYDLTVWLMTLGRERVYRERLVDLAHLTSGESVLDVGCGTGTLAIVSKRRGGPTSTGHGVGAAPGVISKAREKGEKAGGAGCFMRGVLQGPTPPRPH